MTGGTIAVRELPDITDVGDIHAQDLDRVIHHLNRFIEDDVATTMRVIWVPAWLMDEKDELRPVEGSTQVVVARIEATTEKAVLAAQGEDRADWLPKSQIHRFAAKAPVERATASLAEFGGETEA